LISASITNSIIIDICYQYQQQSSLISAINIIDICQQHQQSLISAINIIIINNNIDICYQHHHQH